MRESKEIAIFISHGWDWNERFSQVLGWLSSSRDLNWYNCSLPCHGGMDDLSLRSLERAVTNQLQSADIVLVLAGMHPPPDTRGFLSKYADHRKWIEYEIQEAQRLNKTTIGVKPWDGSPTPTMIREASICEPVGWNAESLVEAVKRHGSINMQPQQQIAARSLASRKPAQCA